MGLRNLPIVFSNNKHSISIVGHASDFDGAASILRLECKAAGTKFSSKNLRCFSSAARIFIHDKISAAFPCFLYENRKQEVVSEKPKQKISLKVKQSRRVTSKAKGTR